MTTTTPAIDPTPELTPKPKTTMGKLSTPQWRRQLRYVYLRFLRLQGSPEHLARGMASGVFAGCFPLFGLQTLIGIGVATVLRGNRLMAAASTWVSNPFTYVPIFAFNYQVGHWLLGGTATPAFDNLDTLKNWMDMGTEVSVRLMLGSAVVGLVAGFASYFGGLPLIRRVRWSKTGPRGQRASAPDRSIS
ncbi:DUF2062 domain-containing protein [Nodosilinea sp. PGN35]|uniref:DUF2062 domain-containing protein n=1 Tax=Nodosilinea sp. PGN35 TaxID=3020489 RepID=UPI0023B243AE|nr:DUF2062 domain-containing protein [Nodosilinea sp. TSF1-S3]MDF0367643.1 DUF2062 domain-containing protein [Nodosilinea sp. TSF1-S3]